ncbi:ATP-binding protein [Thermodesulfobacteriota bacterium B35]
MLRLADITGRRLAGSLAFKIMAILAIGVGLIMAVDISLSVNNQRQLFKQRMTDFGRELGSLAYAGIKHPMAVGDSASIEKQLFDIRDQLQGTEIVLCDFEQEIVFATDTRRINTRVDEFVHDRKTLDALARMLQGRGPVEEEPFEEQYRGRRYLVTMRVILNEKECHHCHGASRKVLGGLLTRFPADATYRAIASLRNRTIAISALGVGCMLAFIYLVTRPLTELAARAERLARGDLSVSMPDSSGDSVGILGRAFNDMVTSIKEQIEIADSLKKAIADPLFMVDRDMVITYMNEPCVELTGHGREEVEGRKTCQEILMCENCGTSACPIRQTFADQRPVSGIRATIVTRDGKRVPVMGSASVLRDARGRVIGAVEVLKDITDVLRAERLAYVRETARREEEQRRHLEAMAENILETLAQASRGNLKVRATPSGQQDIMDKIVLHTNHMLDNLEKLYDKISSFSREMEQEVARRTAMLRERTYLLEQANRDLKELDRLKSSFLANMSHELRTPMNSIIGYTDLLLDGVDGEINEEQEKDLRKVADNARHLLQLINDILDMSKIESGRMELVLERTDITGLIESVAATFRPALEEKQLTLSFDFAPDLPEVYIDRDKIRQVLINLLSNAVKFTDQGEITIHVHPSDIGIEAGDEPEFVEVCVEDTGIGIRRQDMKKLFDKFSQIDVSSIRQYEGTGLGLSIARGLVVLHKGVIWAESEFGTGTRMYFTVPVDEKLFDRSARPALELAMAEKLGEHFMLPADVFLRPVEYGGRPVKCWQYTHCGQTSCPAYESSEYRCWLIPGTHCKGHRVCKYPHKMEFCRSCEVLEQLVLEADREITAARAVEHAPGGEDVPRAREEDDGQQG